MNWPGTMEVEAGNTRWELCLWWEAIPRVLQDGSCSWMQRRSEWEVRDEVGGASRAESRVREPKADFQKRGTEAKVACGRESRKDGRERGRQVVEPAVGCSGSGSGPKTGSGAFLKGDGGLFSKEGLGWTEGPSPFCPNLSGWTKGPEEPFGLFKPEAHLDHLREPVPSRAPPKTVGTLTEMEEELLVARCVGSMEPSLGHRKPTDDALLYEASRYPRNLKSPIFSLGCGASSPSPLFLGSDVAVVGKVGVINDLFGAVEEERSMAPTREEWLADLSVHEDGNMSPRVSGDEANGTDLSIVPF